MHTRTLAGRYQLDSVLGRGGMAVVWRGVDLELGRQVAIKTVDLTGTDPLGSPERFRREARTTAALSHPNIVTIFDTGVDADTAFLVMEMLSGPTLAERLAQHGPLPVGEVVNVARQVCAALMVAHAAAVVHRDIKPANLAYSADGTVKVLDFGITRILDEITGPGSPTVTATGAVLGTAAYLSPEQASGAPIDGRADLYALGCVLTALLTGSPPFTGESPVAVMVQQVHNTPPPITATRPDVPAALAALIGQLLAKDPAQRPASATEVAARLAALQRDDADTALPPGSEAAMTRPLTAATALVGAPRHKPSRRSWWVVAAAAAAALAALLIAVLNAGTDRGARQPAAQTTPTSTSTTSATPISRTASSTAPTSPAPATPAAAIAALRAAVAQAASSGDLDPAAAGDLNHRLDDLTLSLSGRTHGKPGKSGGAEADAGQKVADLVKQLGHLADSGQITNAGEQILAGPLAALEGLVPPAD